MVALGSIQGGILQPIQQHTWDVTFGHEMENATLFTLHPFYSGYELAMFFPEEIRAILTPEQQEKLDSLHERRGPRREGRMGGEGRGRRRGGPPPPPPVQ